jgi:Lrp/AsnC family leucine-responsive transcriptional regulator
MTDEMDYLLRVRMEHMEHFSCFMMDTLLRCPAPIDVKSSCTLHTLKEMTSLPLR